MITSDAVVLIANVSFIVSIIFFFFSFIQLINKNKPLSNYFLSIIFSAVGVQCLSFWFYFRDSPVFEKYFYYSDTAFLFLIGPFLYLFFLYITSEARINLKNWLHVAPFFTALFIIEGINLYYPSLEYKAGHPIVEIITTLSYLSLFVYLALIFRTLNSYYRNIRKSPEIKTLIYIIVISLVFSFLLILSNTLLPELLYVSHIAFLCIPLSFIFFLIRYPDYFIKAQKESQKSRYRNSQIQNLDKDKVAARLDELMEQERVYRDRSLSLKSLGERLEISSPQLSELLNSHYRTNFNNLINSYRIEEVKKILNEKDDANILEIALECGFNSKSTFNAAFRKYTGLSPTEYKKQYIF